MIGDFADSSKGIFEDDVDIVRLKLKEYEVTYNKAD